MSFLRSVLTAPKAATPGRQSVPEYRAARGWSEAQYCAARALGLPEPLQLVEQSGGVMQPTFHVRLEAAAEWQRDFDRLVPGLKLVTLSQPGVSNQIALAEVLDSLEWTAAQHATAVQRLGFPAAHDAEVRDASGARIIAVLRRHEVDRWLDSARLLVSSHLPCGRGGSSANPDVKVR